MSKTFTVHTDSLHLARETLRSSYMRIRRNLEEIEFLRRRLAEYSGMESCIQRLRRLEEKVETELLVLGQMCRALERALECYPGAENRVIQECESLETAVVLRALGINDFERINKQIRELALF